VGSSATPKLSDDVSLVVPIITCDMATGAGKHHTSQWIQQELGFAARPSVPFLFVIEEGASFGETDTGSIERIRFPSGKFPRALGRIVNQITALQHSVIVTRDLPEIDLSDRVWRLILEAREQAAKSNYEQFLQLSEETLKLDPTAWRAALNVGVALVKLGRLADAERAFLDLIEAFDGNDQAKALAYHNLGWREQVRSAGDYKNARSLRAEAGYYEKALAFMHSKTHTRASLIQCKVLLGELGEASALLLQSLNYRGFLEALRYETENRGYLGHQILRQLPESEWLYPLLFPVWQAADDELRDNERLV